MGELLQDKGTKGTEQMQCDNPCKKKSLKAILSMIGKLNMHRAIDDIMKLL